MIKRSRNPQISKLNCFVELSFLSFVFAYLIVGESEPPGAERDGIDQPPGRLAYLREAGLHGEPVLVGGQIERVYARPAVHTEERRVRLQLQDLSTVRDLS